MKLEIVKCTELLSHVNIYLSICNIGTILHCLLKFHLNVDHTATVPPIRLRHCIIKLNNFSIGPNNLAYSVLLTF